MRHLIVALSLALAACASDPQQGEEPRCDPIPACEACDPFDLDEVCLRCQAQSATAVCAPGLVPYCTFRGLPPEWSPDVEGRPINGYQAFCRAVSQMACGTLGSSSSIEGTEERDGQPVEVRCWCPEGSDDPDCLVTE